MKVVIAANSAEAERDRLVRSLAEKEVLLKEVQHRVKNNLQVITSLLRMQEENTKYPQVAAALRECQHRVESMALIHEQLYESEDLRVIDIAANANLLLSNLLHSFGVDPARITGRVAIEPLLLGVDQAIPANLILNELISNALKHAFPGARTGAIVVDGHVANGDVHLSVRDDGIGIPDDLVIANGLRIVTILARQLKGALTYDRSSGTVFRVCFPKGVQ